MLANPSSIALSFDCAASTLLFLVTECTVAAVFLCVLSWFSTFTPQLVEASWKAEDILFGSSTHGTTNRRINTTERLMARNVTIRNIG